MTPGARAQRVSELMQARRRIDAQIGALTRPVQAERAEIAPAEALTAEWWRQKSIEESDDTDARRKYRRQELGRAHMAHVSAAVRRGRVARQNGWAAS